MAAAIVGQQRQPYSSTCAGCGTRLNHHSVYEINTCLNCKREYCSRCFNPKLNVDLPSNARSSAKYCGACEEFLTIQREINLNDETSQRTRRRNKSPDEGFRKLSPPVKPVHAAHEILNNISVSRTNDVTRHFPTSASQLVNKSEISRSSRLRAKRNDRGLFSKSDVPNVIDNRYYYLNKPERNSNETSSQNIGKQNFFTKSAFKKPVPPEKPLRSFSASKDYQTTQYKEGQQYEEWNDDFEHEMYSERLPQYSGNYQQFDSKYNIKKDTLAKRPENHSPDSTSNSNFKVASFKPETNGENDALFNAANHFEQEETTRSAKGERNSEKEKEQGMTQWKSGDFPQNSQYYNKTIVYPSSTAGNPFLGQRKSYNMDHRYDRYEQFDNSYDSGGSYDSYGHQNTVSHRSTHRTRQRGHLSAKFGRGEPFDDMPTEDDLEDFDDLDDVPAFNEIPYALLMTETLDKKTIRRAQRKQMQQTALDLIKSKTVTILSDKNLMKNKNQGPLVSKNSKVGMDTHTEQINTSSKPRLIDNVQCHAGGRTKNNDTASPLEDDLSLMNNIHHNISDSNNNAAENVIDRSLSVTHTDSFPSKDAFPSKAHERISDNAMNTCLKESFKGTDKTEEEHRDVGKLLSPNNEKDKRAFVKSSIARGSERELVTKEEKKSLTSANEKTLTDREDERFIREKRLEKLNAKEGNPTHKIQEETKKKKPDNRELAFHSDVVHKPVKPTAFPTKVPNFIIHENALQSKIPEEPAASDSLKIPADSKVHAKLNSSINMSNSKNDAKPDREPEPKGVGVTNSRPNNKFATHLQKSHNDTGREVRLKGTTKVSRTDDKEDKETEPIAMKILRRQRQQKDNLSKTLVAAQSAEYDEDMIEPSAMRLLRQSREAKARKERMKTQGSTMSQYGDESLYDNPFSILTNILGGKFEDFPGTRPNTLGKSDDRSDAKQLKPVKKNKNKNISSVTKTGQRMPVKEANHIVDSEVLPPDVSENKQQHDKPQEKNATNQSGSKNVRVSAVSSENRNSLEISKIADNRHRAFQKLKMSQSEDHLRCTSCGRPECEGLNIRKMKEIIRMAKKAGFDVRDVTPDGNCMFAAVIDQLQMYGDNSFGPKSLREAAVHWLIEHPYSEDGTHYSSFLSADWETYLQRMMAEGEWGDHLILRAIVETVGHTIKVLNVSGEESHWTILEPATIDSTKDGMHLVLGHVGEFHYTSLRPAEDKGCSFVAAPMSQTAQRALSLEEDGQLSLEGTETIEMFREDFIDSMSDMPSVHFSYLLKHVIPIKVVEKAAILQSHYTEMFNSMPLQMTDHHSGNPMETEIELGGSVVEGLYVPHLTETISQDSTYHDTEYVDTYGIMKKYVVVDQFSTEVYGGERFECVLNATGVHPGYTKLLCKQRSAEGFNEFTSNLPQIKLTSYLDERSRCHEDCRNGHVHQSMQSAIRSQIWPGCAKSWVSRARREGWPPKDIISSVESEGCLLLSKAHETSPNPLLEWQFSFVLGEKKLFRDAVSLFQKYCFMLFNALCTQTMGHLASISSSHLKSIFFYSCERIPSEYWESSPGACVLYMLDELQRYVRAKHLPDYFIDTNNMLDHLSEKDFKEIEEQIILLRSQPVLFLRQIDESIDMVPNGNSVIDKVSDDIPQFKEHKSLKRSTLEVFIPATIDTAHYYIRRRSYEYGYEILSQAFQERLSVSTCDDSVPFQIFLPGAVSGLDLDSLVWFSAYTDKQLEGQLSKSLIRETCGDLQLVKIKDMLPADVVGSYGNTEVPADFLTSICRFCHDFAKFLYQINKLSEILPILYHCHVTFVKKLETEKSLHADEGKGDKQPTIEDFTDEAMFEVYSAMYAVYYKQRQIQFFGEVLPVFEALVGRIHTRWAYSCLCYIYKDLGDNGKLTTSTSIYCLLPEDPMENTRVSAFLYWPYKVKMYVPT